MQGAYETSRESIEQRDRARELLDALIQTTRPRFIVIPGKLTIPFNAFAKMEKGATGMYIYWREEDEKELKWLLISQQECDQVEKQLKSSH